MIVGRAYDSRLVVTLGDKGYWLEREEEGFDTVNPESPYPCGPTLETIIIPKELL